MDLELLRPFGDLDELHPVRLCTFSHRLRMLAFEVSARFARALLPDGAAQAGTRIWWRVVAQDLRTESAADNLNL